MKNVVKTIIVLGMSLIFCGALAGCRKSEKDYVGIYVAEWPEDEAHGIKKRVLEIKIAPGQIRPDYTWEQRTEYKSTLMSDFTSSGRWEIIEGKIVLHGSAVTIAPETIKAELRGNKLLDHANNRIYIKQN